MPSVITEGLVLKRKNFGEADRILTVLTDRFGKISVIAKGVRRITSRRAGNVELLNRVKLHLYKSKNYILTEAESLETFSKLKENLTLSINAFHIAELLDRLIPENQKNPLIYKLTLETLRLLEKNPRQIFIRAFEVKLLSLLGFFATDAIKEVDKKIKILLEKLEIHSMEEISYLKISGSYALALEEIMRYYIERILESELKSVLVMRSLKKY